MTKEDIIELESYCAENKISKRKVLKQKNITYYNYYTSRQRLQLDLD
ncbi:MAG: hypothetical protein RR407_06365 [Bacteroidales bacterium]